MRKIRLPSFLTRIKLYVGWGILWSIGWALLIYRDITRDESVGFIIYDVIMLLISVLVGTYAYMFIRKETKNDDRDQNTA